MITFINDDGEIREVLMDSDGYWMPIETAAVEIMESEHLKHVSVPEIENYLKEHPAFIKIWAQ